MHISDIRDKPLKAMYDYIFIKALDESGDKKTPGGIIIPNLQKDTETVHFGTVHAIGAGLWENGKEIPVPAKEGDIVAHVWHKGNDCSIPGHGTFIVIRFRDVIANFGQ